MTRKIPLSAQIAAAMAAGLVVGAVFGRGAVPLGELGKLVIQLVKAAAAPLLFFAILNAILRTDVGARDAGRMVLVATVNASIALSFGLFVSNFFEPGRHLRLEGLTPASSSASIANQKIDLMKALGGWIPSSFVEPFVQNSVLTLVVIALLLGFGLRAVRREQEKTGERGARALEDGVTAALQVMEKVLGWIIRLIPLAVFGVVAKAVGEYGLEPLKGLAAYVAAGLLGLTLHSLVTYQAWLALYARLPLRRFWAAAKEPVIYAAGANSSLATLPVTLRALDGLGVSKSSSTLGACVGTNLNNDGIILYEAMAVLFVAQAHGLDLSLGQQVVSALLCLVAAMGIAGVPEAGFVSLSLVLATVGLPTELLPLLLTVDWIIARGRSVVNVLSDMMVSIILDRMAGRSFAVARPLQASSRAVTPT